MERSPTSGNIRSVHFSSQFFPGTRLCLHSAAGRQWRRCFRLRFTTQLAIKFANQIRGKQQNVESYQLHVLQTWPCAAIGGWDKWNQLKTLNLFVFGVKTARFEIETSSIKYSKYHLPWVNSIRKNAFHLVQQRRTHLS